MPAPSLIMMTDSAAQRQLALAYGHSVVTIDPNELQETLYDIYKKLDAPGEAVKAALQGGDQAVIFVIAGTQSVPIPFKRGDSLDAVFTQLRLLLT